MNWSTIPRIASVPFLSCLLAGQVFANASPPIETEQSQVARPDAQAMAIEAIKALNIDDLRKALELGADPNKKDKDRRWPLFGAPILELMSSDLSDEEVDGLVCQALSLMHEFGGNVETIDEPLVIPALCNGPVTAQWLIDHGADVNEQDREGLTPLYYAIRYRHERVEECLRKSGANPYKDEIDRQIRFVGASYAGDLDAIESSVKDGIEVNLPDCAGRTALFDCIALGHVEIARVLLTHGASPNVPSNGMASLKSYPLHEAVQSSMAYGQSMKPNAVDWEGFEIVQLLLEHNAEVSKARPYDGKTPLHIAAEWGIVRTAEALIKAGAKVMPRDADGKTPLDYAESGPMIQLLKASGAVER